MYTLAKYFRSSKFGVSRCFGVKSLLTSFQSIQWYKTPALFSNLIPSQAFPTIVIPIITTYTTYTLPRQPTTMPERTIFWGRHRELGKNEEVFYERTTSTRPRKPPAPAWTGLFLPWGRREDPPPSRRTTTVITQKITANASAGTRLLESRGAPSPALRKPTYVYYR